MQTNKVLIAGSFGIDTIITPFEKRENVMGGSAVYAGYSASFFAEPELIGIIGEDFPGEFLEALKKRKIGLLGVQRKGKSFRWAGKYSYDMNQRETISLELNCITQMKAEVPESLADASYVMLGNLDPELQLGILEKLKSPKLVMADTIDHWITTKKEKLLELLKKITVLVINDSEARLLFKSFSLVASAKKALSYGLKAVIIKKGEHGALLFTKGSYFNAPGYPLEELKDPTGCGDCFAGAFLGYLASKGSLSEKELRKAVVYGSVIASFNAEGFSLEKLSSLTSEQIEKRYNEFLGFTKF